MRFALALVGIMVSGLTPLGAQTPRTILLLGQGPDGHPPQTHEYDAGLKILARCLASHKGLKVMSFRADEPWREGPELLERADGVVLYLAEGARWVSRDPKRHEALKRLAQRSGSLIALHWAIGTREAGPIEPFLALLGGCHGGPDRKYQVLETKVTPVEGGHPIVRGLSSFKIRDEFYYRLKFVKPEGTVTPLLRATIEGREEVVAWAWERPDGGRSFGYSGLHFHASWDLPQVRRLVTQGILWSMKLPIPEQGVEVTLP